MFDAKGDYRKWTGQWKLEESLFALFAMDHIHQKRLTLLAVH